MKIWFLFVTFCAQFAFAEHAVTRESKSPAPSVVIVGERHPSRDTKPYYHDLLEGALAGKFCLFDEKLAFTGKASRDVRLEFSVTDQGLKMTENPLIYGIEDSFRVAATQLAMASRDANKFVQAEGREILEPGYELMAHLVRDCAANPHLKAIWDEIAKEPKKLTHSEKLNPKFAKSLNREKLQGVIKALDSRIQSDDYAKKLRAAKDEKGQEALIVDYTTLAIEFHQDPEKLLSFVMLMREIGERYKATAFSDEVKKRENTPAQLTNLMVKPVDDSFYNKVMVEWRDELLARNIATLSKQCAEQGKTVYAILGDAHAPGVVSRLKQDHRIADVEKRFERFP
jgi:hypothetical protein